MSQLFKEIAYNNQTSERAVKQDLRLAIEQAKKSDNPQARAFWEAAAPGGSEPSLEKVIALLAERVRERMKEKADENLSQSLCETESSL